MENNQQKNQRDFIKEQIVGRKPTKAERIAKAVRIAGAGALFGLAAAAVFGICLFFFQHFLSPNTEVQPQETQESTAETEDGMPANEEELEKFVSEMLQSDKKEDLDFYDGIREAVKDLKWSTISVNAVKKEVDWFAVSYDSLKVQMGLIIKHTPKQYYILTGYSSLKNADSLKAEFADGSSISAELKGFDAALDVALLSVEREKLPEETRKQIQIGRTGNTALLETGMPVFAIGSPSGTTGSVGIGFISFINESLKLTDCTVRGIQSSIPVENSGSSFLMAADGTLLGFYPAVSKNPVSAGYSQAYSIQDVLISVENILNGTSTLGIGIKGTDIDEETRSEHEIPEGIYVTAVEKGSAAYQAGVQTGDVLAELGKQKITSMADYERVMKELSPGREVNMIVYRNSKDVYKKMEFTITPAVRQN